MDAEHVENGIIRERERQKEEEKERQSHRIKEFKDKVVSEDSRDKMDCP